ncbi:hypothetical protein ACUXS1_001953 [Staphylococcus warneri]
MNKLTIARGKNSINFVNQAFIRTILSFIGKRLQ